MSNDRLKNAFRFALNAHKGQVRRYVGEDYFFHPLRVSFGVAGLNGSEDMMIAALLHDVVEDTDISLETISQEFGPEVAKLVDELTDKSKPSDGNRATRKAIDRERLASASAEAQTIKVLDLIDNTESIIRHDPDFAKVYLPEKEALIELLTKADPRVLEIAKTIISNWKAMQ